MFVGVCLIFHSTSQFFPLCVTFLRHRPRLPGCELPKAKIGRPTSDDVILVFCFARVFSRQKFRLYSSRLASVKNHERTVAQVMFFLVSKISLSTCYGLASNAYLNRKTERHM